jgi:streptogramin lyase
MSARSGRPTRGRGVIVIVPLVLGMLAAGPAPTAAALVDASGATVPNTGTGSTTAELDGPIEILERLATPSSPADDDPDALAALGSPSTPEDDLAAALDELGSADDPAVAEAAVARAIDILEGNPVPHAAYSGIPLLNWNAPAKVKTVPAGGVVTVRVVRYGEHILTDTSLLRFDDPTRPFEIRYRIAELGTVFGGQLTPAPLLEDGSARVGGVHSVTLPLALGAMRTGTQESSRFHPEGADEQTRQAVQDITVRMPPAGMTDAILDPNLRPGWGTLATPESFATLRRATPERLSALAGAFGFSGDTPTRAEVRAAIGVLGDAAPEKRIWTDLTALDPNATGFLAAATAVGREDRSLVSEMRVRTQIPAGVDVDPTADVVVTLLNDEAYVSQRMMRLPRGGSLRVQAVNADGFPHEFEAVDLHDRVRAFGPLDWGEFAWDPLALGAGGTLAPGESRTYTLAPDARSFALWLGDGDAGDQASVALGLDRGPRLDTLRFERDFDFPLHGTFDGEGTMWVTMPGSDSIARIVPAADLQSSDVAVFPLPGGAHDPTSPTPALGPLDIAVDGRGILWATLAAGNAIARVDPSLVQAGTGRGITIYPLAPCPTECPPAFPPPPVPAPPTRAPTQMAAMEDGDGNSVIWFTELNANRIGMLRVAPDGTRLNQVDYRCLCAAPKGIGLAADGDVWFSEELSNQLGQLALDPTRPFAESLARVRHFPIPSSVENPVPGIGVVRTSAPHAIVIDPRGRVWFTEEATGKVGFLDPRQADAGTSAGMREFAVPDNEFGGIANPADITVDRAGTVYFTDEYGDVIRSVTVDGMGPSWRPAARNSLTDKPMVAPNGDLWFLEPGATLLTRVSGVTDGSSLPGRPPFLRVDTDENVLVGARLDETESVDLAVFRGGAIGEGGTEVAHANGVVVDGGSIVAGDVETPWAGPATDPLRPGDLVQVALHGAYPRAPFSFPVARLDARVLPDGSLAGHAFDAVDAAPLFGHVHLSLQAGERDASIDPDDGSFSTAFADPLDPATSSGTVAWTGATAAVVYRTTTGFRPPPPDTEPPKASGGADVVAISPNGDGRNDALRVSASFSETTRWTLEVLDGSTVLASSSGRGAEMSESWDGASAGGTVVDGFYTWRLSGTDLAGNAMVPLDGPVVVDTIGPAAPTIDAAPADPSADATPVFAFSPAEPGSSLECSLSEGLPAYAPCSSPKTYSAKADGSYTFSVRATDPAGNTGPAASASLRIDTAGPAVSVDAAPPARTNDPSPTFSFSSTEASVKFECSLSAGGASFTACASPATFDAVPDGAYTFRVRAIDALGNVGPAADVAFEVDTLAPTASASPGGGAFDRAISVSLTSSEPGEIHYTTNGTAPTSASPVYAGPLLIVATTTVRFLATDRAGNASQPRSEIFTIDTAPPVARAPVLAIVRGATLKGGSVVASLEWSGADSGSGIAGYRLQESTDGGATWSDVVIPAGATSLRRRLLAGTAHRFRVRAEDAARNLSAWAAGPDLRAAITQERSSSIAFAGSWTTTSSASASGGALRWASAAGARATYSFSGRNVAWVAATGPNRGRAEVWLDGVRVATVDLYSPTRSDRRVVFTTSTAAGAHQLQVRVLGRHDPASTGDRIDVDAFATIA